MLHLPRFVAGGLGHDFAGVQDIDQFWEKIPEGLQQLGNSGAF